MANCFVYSQNNNGHINIEYIILFLTQYIESTNASELDLYYLYVSLDVFTSC